jgi:pimeloyl-ACP methyl ester carboxylesterase
MHLGTNFKILFSSNVQRVQIRVFLQCERILYVIKKMKVYFISGLAADKRVFKYIQLPEGYEAVHLDWITPHKKESLQDYSIRLAESIQTTEPFALLGLSMGGMIASEIAKKYPPVITILLSSISSYKHLPTHLKLVGKLGLHKLMPVSVVKSAAIMKRLFTAETPEDKTTLKQIIRESDTQFIRWAMDAILKWRNEDIPQPIYHLHGTRDEILPVKYAKPTHFIQKGGHLMVMNRAAEVNRFLEEALSSFKNNN